MERINFEIKRRSTVSKPKKQQPKTEFYGQTYMYLRGSTLDIDLQNQKQEISKYAATKNITIDYVLEETVSGSVKAANRQLGALIDNAKPGDQILVTEFSRIGRSLTDVLNTLQIASERKIGIVICRLDLRLDDSIAAKTLAFAFSLAAEIERSLISERTKAGLQKALANGKKLGRPKCMNKAAPRKLDGEVKRIKELLDAGVSSSAISRLFGVHRLTVASFIKDRLNKNITHSHGRK